MTQCTQFFKVRYQKFLISALIKEHFFTADEVNDNIGQIFNLLSVKKTSRGISPIDRQKGVNFTKMSATKMWAFVLFFPAAMSSKVPSDSQH